MAVDPFIQLQSDDPGASVSVSPAADPFVALQGGAVPATPAAKLKWSQVPGAMLRNVIPDAVSTIGNTAKAIAGPGLPKNPTAADISDATGFGGFVGPAIRGLGGAIAQELSPESLIGKGPHPIGNAVAGGLSSINPTNGNLPTTIGTHPFQTLANVAGLADGLAPLADIGGLGQTANALRTVSHLNPVTLPVRVLGAALSRTPGLNAVANGANNALMNYRLGPVNRTLLDATEGQPQQVLNTLQAPGHELVPGAVPTAPEAASSLGLTRFNALQGLLADHIPTENAARVAATDAALVHHLQDIADTSGGPVAARAARTAASDPLYNAANGQLVESDPRLEEILDTPAGRAAISPARIDMVNAAINPANDQRPFQIGGQPAVSSVLVDHNGNPLGSGTPAQPVQYPGTSIQTLKMVLDRAIKNPNSPGFEGLSASHISDVKNALVDWANQNLDGWQQARETHAAMSQPVNQADLGQQLVNTINPATGVTDASKGAFLKAVAPQGQANTIEAAQRNAANTIPGAKTPGQRYFNQFGQMIDPQSVGNINAVQNHILRERATSGVTTNGPDVGADLTAGDTVNAAVHAVHAATGNFWSTTRVANWLMQRAGASMTEAQATALARRLMTAPGGADALEEAMNRQAQLQTQNQANQLRNRMRLNALAAPGRAIGAINPMVYNALSPNNQQSQ